MGHLLKIKSVDSRVNVDIFALKGHCHEIFCFRFFSWITFPQAPDTIIRIISNFFRKFAEIFASQGAPPVSLTPVANLPPVSTTPAAFATGINDTGGKFCHQFPLCCWHRWQICQRCQRYQRQFCRRCQRRRWLIATGINNTGCKFATRVIDTGGK